MAFNAQKDAATKLSVHFDATLANRDAAAWAQDYTDAVVEQLGTTTESNVGDILSQWIETPGATMGDLVKSLTPWFDRTRASRIAASETSRAFAHGEAMAYEREGIGSPVIFPVDDTHPNCYCWFSVKRVNGQAVVVWQTNKDDRVCDQNIETPWGVVGGCQALDGVVVSDGDYVGQYFDEIEVEKMAKSAAVDHTQPPYLLLYGSTVDGRLTAWVVDGNWVRNTHDNDYIGGGNAERWKFIPAGEVWLDNHNLDEGLIFLLHELHEEPLMAAGWSYDDAHESAKEVEAVARADHDKIPGLLAAEGWEPTLDNAAQEA